MKLIDIFMSMPNLGIGSYVILRHNMKTIDGYDVKIFTDSAIAAKIFRSVSKCKTVDIAVTLLL